MLCCLGVHLCVGLCDSNAFTLMEWVRIWATKWIRERKRAQKKREQTAKYKLQYKKKKKKKYRSQTHVERNYNFHMQKVPRERERTHEIIIEAGTNMGSLKCQ